MKSLIKHSILLITLLFVTNNLFSQMKNNQYGNEWINHNQTYYKIDVQNDGFYKIDYNTLTSYVTDINNVNPQSIQMFHMGEEIPVYVESNNGVINEISFYAENKQSSIDKNLYRNTNDYFNPEYSLISDMGTYFLTWSNSVTSQYQTQSSSFNNLPNKEEFFMYESSVVNKEHWNKGEYYSISGYELSNGTFDCGEGYGSTFSTTNVTTLETPYVYDLETTSFVNIISYVRGSSQHTPQMNIGSYTETYNNFYGDSVLNIVSMFPTSNVVDGSTNVELKGLNGNTDKNSVSVVKIKYPRHFNFDGESVFKFSLVSGSRRYIEVENFNGDNQNVYLYDITNKRRIECFWDGVSVHIELPSSTSDMDLVLVNESYKKPIVGLTSTDFLDYSLDMGDYIIITNEKLFVDSKGNNPIFDYATYRTSTGEKPVIVPVNRLYDQFSYGVKGHPMAIKNFVSFITKKWNNIVPKNLFIIGKGITYNDIRTSEVETNLVPTFGYPPSDNLLVSPIDSDVPMLPVGRLSATNGDEVTDYLNKIKKLENSAFDSLDIDNQSWRKQTIHLGGGANSYEHNILKNHLLNMEPVMENGFFGANVHSFFKEHNEYVSTPNTIQINNLINNGVSMVTFFGHGSTKGFDFYLDAPENYNNKDRYPLVMALGCYNGTIFNEEKLLSERFIFEKEAGAIGYIGFVNAVTISAASGLSTNFYNFLNNDLYGYGVGEIIKRTIETYTNTSSYQYNPYNQMGTQYFVFHGDPVLKLNYKTTPDLHIEKESVKTTPNTITADVRNFNLDIDVYNFGKFVDSLVTVKVIRKNPMGKITTIDTDITIPRNKSKISFMFSVNGYEDFGMNYFTIIIDPDNKITELPANAETNNKVMNFEVVIGNPIVSPTYPKEFSIVNDSNIVLKAMTTNAFNTDYSWEIEMDTTTHFNSNMLVKNTLTSESSVVEWNPNVLLTNDKVYYWRVRATDGNNQTSDWMTSSFLYKSNSLTGGWNQSHIFQYKQNELTNILLTENKNNIFEYTPSLYEISARTGYIDYGVDNQNLALYQNGSKIDKCRCEWENGVYVAVMDDTDLQMWNLPGNTSKYGAINCDGGGRTAYSFLFKNNSVTTQKSFESFVTDTIPTGHYVVIYTLNNGHGDRWSSDFVNYLKSQGSTKIDSFVNTTEERSFVMAFRKGYPNHPYSSEEVGMYKNDVISAYSAAYKSWSDGSMTSKVIGPSKSWDNLEWSVSSVENTSNDVVSVDVYGLTISGEKELLYSNITNNNFDLSSINANVYPYIQLKLNNTDGVNNTPAQLNYWRVYGELNSDGAITINDDVTIEYDNVNKVQNVIVDISVWNFGQNVIDSSELEFFVMGSDTTKHKIKTLVPSDSQNILVNIPMVGLVGEQVIIAKLKEQTSESSLMNNWGWVEVNVPAIGEETEVSNELTVGVENNYVSKINNYPNPFSTETNIQFELTSVFDDKGKEIFPTEVNIEMYSTNGLLVTNNTQKAERYNSWVWNGKNVEQVEVPSGIYICTITPLFDGVEKYNEGKRNIFITKN